MGDIYFCLFAADQQADWVLPAAGPPREAGERQEEDGQETAVHAPGVLGMLVVASVWRVVITDDNSNLQISSLLWLWSK